MALNEQEKKQIITKAQEYIELEQEAPFRNEVVNALMKKLLTICMTGLYLSYVWNSWYARYYWRW